MTEKICPECGAAFVPHGTQVSCSDECKLIRKLRQIRGWEQEHGHKRPSRSRRLKLSPHQRMLANLRRRDLLAPKPKIEIIERDGIIIERRGNIPVGGHAADFIRHN